MTGYRWSVIGETPVRENKNTFVVRQYGARKRTLLKLICPDHRCGDCGGVYEAWQLQLDHIDPMQKTRPMNVLLLNAPWDEVLKEAKLCRVICANCHADRTYWSDDVTAKHRSNVHRGATSASYKDGVCSARETAAIPRKPYGMDAKTEAEAA